MACKILSISAATTRFQELIEKLFGSMRELKDGKHNLRMFKEIISAMQDPSNKALQTLAEVIEFEQKVDETISRESGRSTIVHTI